jgi:alpha-L-fucosidase 2
MMQPLFQMYQDAMPLAHERTRHFFGHAGAYFPETLYFWGTHSNENYGWDRTEKNPGDIQGGAIAKHYNGNLELLALMLDYYTYTGDTEFLRQTLLPMADPLLLFWEAHYSRAVGGAFRITGGQALETYGGVTNPAPDIAGLQWVLDGLLGLPKGLVPAHLQTRWATFRRALPPVPTGEDAGGRYLRVCDGPHGSPGNYENPELYAIFPFRLYGVGKADLDVARRAFVRRIFMGNRGWEQDDIQAAMLGLTDTAAQYVAERFATSNTGHRFPAIWGPNYDWLPDQDHGGVAMRALQAMLVQEDGAKILLLPAWPPAWDVDFKLHAAGQTTVECRYRAGKIERLVVTPAGRAKDVVSAL